MTVKKKLTILLVGALSICLFFAFGFEIGVSGDISEEEGTANVSLIGPLRIAADEADAALAEAEQAVLDALAAQAALELILTDPTTALAEAEQAVLDAETAVLEAQKKVDDTLALSAGVDPESPEGILLAVQLLVDEEALEAAQLALEDAQAILAEVELILADSTALGLILAEPIAALDAARQAVLDALEDPALTEAKLAVLEAEAALEEAEAGGSESMYSHIILNSNNGGSFTGDYIEGNQSGVDGQNLNFTFESYPGFDLIWLRVGNTKFATTEEANGYIYSSDKKNLTIHAHFKKNKDDSPEITTEETGEPVKDEKGNGKGKDKEKSNNGKKNKK